MTNSERPFVTKDSINDAYVNGGYTGLMALAERLLAERDAFREVAIENDPRQTISAEILSGMTIAKARKEIVACIGRLVDAEARRLLLNKGGGG
jgi:hypothetical protein